MHIKTHSIAAPFLFQRGFIKTSLFATLGLSAAVFNASADSLKVDGTPVGAGVPTAIARTNSPETIVAPGFSLQLVAQGIELLENPSGVITRFGFLGDTNNTKTEPDENTFLVLDHNPGGPTPGYDYGRHFLFQGHENSGNRAYITRINLDVVNPDHRITLLTPVGTNGLTGFNSIDGSTWNPFSKTLLFSQEAGGNGGFIEMGADFDPSTGAGAGLRTLYGSLGRGGFEGVHVDDQGNLIVIEDVGGTRVNVDPNDPASPKQAALPNSFVYRFVPANPADLSQGKLQALQVSINGQPLVYVPTNAANPFGDVFSDNQLKLHTLGTSWPAQWVTVHDTAIDGTASFDANAAAKAAGATPFKRPENVAFQPGSSFQTFFITVTGDTDARAGNQPALATRGSWGSIFRVDLAKNR
jgi:Alkaline phosphatase PhoX